MQADNKRYFTSTIPNPHWLGLAMHDLRSSSYQSESGFNPEIIKLYSKDLFRIKRPSLLIAKQLEQGLKNGILYKVSSQHPGGVWGLPFGEIAPGTEIINVEEATTDQILTFGRNCLIHCIAVTAADDEYDTPIKPGARTRYII